MSYIHPGATGVQVLRRPVWSGAAGKGVMQEIGKELACALKGRASF